MLINWSKENINLLNCESARTFVVSEIIPACLQRCNEEHIKQGREELTHEEFMTYVGLTGVSATTAWRWLRLLGFRYKSINKSYYTDRHEDNDNVKARMKFINDYFSMELKTYRWVQIKKKEAEMLETSTQKFPLQKERYRKEYQNKNDNNEWYREYHVDINPALLEYVSNDNRIKQGGDLSIDFPKGE